MAPEEIEMENVPLMDKPDWVLQLEEELLEVKTSGHNLPAVFSVAKASLASEQQYYIPRFISIGPYHFGREEFRRMEPHKAEAVRRMQERIHGKTMRSIVETEIVAMETSIREFYEGKLPYSAIELAWMVTKDSCFIFEFILNYIRTRPDSYDFHNDCVVEGRYDAVLSSSRTNPIWRNILYDLALFENQIPFYVLEHLLTIADSISDPGAILVDFFEALTQLDGNMVFRWGKSRPYVKEQTRHFLEVLYNCDVSTDFACYEGEAYPLKERRLLHLGWPKSIFTCGCPRWMRRRGVQEDISAFQVKIPSAAELKKKGVNLCALTDRNCAVNEGIIQWVQFEEETSTLYLPQVDIDHFRHFLLRNFIALEYTSEKYRSVPITSFTSFMNELIDSEQDVAFLREANIIRNFSGSDKEAAEFFNALPRGNPVFEGCKPIDDARVGLNKYLRRECKILWNEFISTYCAKPWLVAGSVAATLLLLMTVAQVFCLFYTCNPST